MFISFVDAEKTSKNQADATLSKPLDKYTEPPNVKSIVSKGGIKTYHMKDSSAPLIHIKIAFRKSGSSYQEKSKFGAPVLYSSTVLYGAGKYTENELEQKLKNISTDINCSYDYNNVTFSIVIPAIVLKEAIPFVNAVINNPAFEKDKVKMMQNAIAGGLQNHSANTDFSGCNIFIPAMIFKSHTYENCYCGSPENFVKLTIEDLKKYKKKYIVKKNAEAWVFGDISEEMATDLVDQILSGLEVGSEAQDTIKDVEPIISNETKKYYVNSPQSTVVFALNGVKKTSVDRYAAVVLFRMLGDKSGLFKSKIMSVLRTQHGLIYGGSVELVHLDHSNYVVGVLKTDNSKVEKAISCLRSILKDLKENGITESDLTFAKNNIKGSLLVGLRTSGRLCHFYFSEIINGCGINALNDTLNGINNVTVDDVKKLSQRILDEKNIPIVVIGGAQ